MANDDEIELTHNKFAKKATTRTNIEKKPYVEYHYVSYIQHPKGHVYQLDGLQREPVIISENPKDKLFIDVINELIEKKKDNIETVVALVNNGAPETVETVEKEGGEEESSSEWHRTDIWHDDRIERIKKRRKPPKQNVHEPKYKIEL